jgi:hypothetical protein
VASESVRRSWSLPSWQVQPVVRSTAPLDRAGDIWRWIPYNIGVGPASGPLNRPRPDPNLMLVTWCSEPDLDCPLGSCHGVGLHKLLNAVFLEDPGLDRMRGGGRADRELPELLRLQAAGLAQGQGGPYSR